MDLSSDSCQPGSPGDTWQPVCVICIFIAKGLLTRCSLLIFKLLDSKASPGLSWTLLFHMVIVANFTFLNYEEGIIGNLMFMELIVITISRAVLSLPPSLSPFFSSSLLLSILLPVFQAFEICQFLEVRQCSKPWARHCHSVSRCRSRCLGGMSKVMQLSETSCVLLLLWHITTNLVV